MSEQLSNNELYKLHVVCQDCPVLYPVDIQVRWIACERKRVVEVVISVLEDGHGFLISPTEVIQFQDVFNHSLTLLSLNLIQIND